MTKHCHFDPFGGVTAATALEALGAPAGANIVEALASLGIDEVTCGSVNIGADPARRILELLEGKPIHASSDAQTDEAGVEMLVSVVTSFEPMPPMRLMRAGFAPGFRAMLGERTKASESTVVTVIETNIDDTTAEILGYAMERLMSAGALDVSFTPMQMKKNRPATLLRVIAKPEDQERLAELVFTETSTAGLRLYQAERRVRPRHFAEVDLGYGKVRVKVTDIGAAPEFDDCRALAIASGKPLKQIFSDALRVFGR